MAAELPGLGSKTAHQFQRVQEQYPLPGSRKEIVEAISSILSKGGLSKLVLQENQPIRVERWVRAGEAGPEMELVDEDIYFAARNAEIKDFGSEADASERVLLNAFRAARASKARPSMFLTHEKKSFAKWLGLPPTDLMVDVYGLEVVEHKDVPEDVLLFICTKAEEPDIIAFSFKILMEE